MIWTIAKRSLRDKDLWCVTLGGELSHTALLLVGFFPENQGQLVIHLSPQGSKTITENLYRVRQIFMEKEA